MLDCSGGVTKKRLDTLFTIHAAVALLAGALAFVLPHVFEHFMISYEEEGPSVAHPGGEDKITHLVTRIYGALILGQAWIVWNARKVEDAHIRRSLVQAYAAVFLLTALALLRAQVTEGGGFNVLNWLNIAMFAGLAGYYAYFVWVEPIKVFQGLGKALS